jgi:hypothetical protein
VKRAYALLALAFATVAFFALRRHAHDRTRSPSSYAAPAADPASARAKTTPRPAKALPPIRVRRLAALDWGDGPAQVGRRHDPESVAEGPMALTRARDGSLYILDQVHGRVLHRRKDGTYAAPIVVGDLAVQDLRATDHGLALLDRLHDHSVHLVDDAKPATTISLASIGVVDPGGTTGVFTDGDDALYVEESLRGEARRVVRPLDGGAILAGRPSRDGRQLLTAAIDRSTRNAFVVRGLAFDGSQRFSTTLTVDGQLLAISLLDSDADGNIYVGVLSATPVPGTYDYAGETLSLVRLDASGDQQGRIDVPHPPSPYTSFRELEVAGVGEVWWMHDAPDGSGVVVDTLSL